VRRGLETAAWRKRTARRRWRREADGGVEEVQRRGGAEAERRAVARTMAVLPSCMKGQDVSAFREGHIYVAEATDMNVAAVHRVPGSTRGLPYMGPKKTNSSEVKKCMGQPNRMIASRTSSRGSGLGLKQVFRVCHQTKGKEGIQIFFLMHGGARKVLSAVRQITADADSDLPCKRLLHPQPEKVFRHNAT
jgi:hypothetical protein